jgi:tight adherence protein B
VTAIHAILIAAFVTLIAGLLLAMGWLKREEAWRKRAEAVLSGHHRAESAPPGMLEMAGRLLMAWRGTHRAAKLMGIRLDRVSDYRPRWFVVLGVAFLAGRIGGAVAGDLLHEGLVIPATLVGAILASRALFGLIEGRRRDALYRQFPDALGQIVRAVRVGLPVVEAIRNVAEEAPSPTNVEFRAIADRLTLGVPIDEALAETALRTGLPEYRFFATALTLQARAGGALSETLENLAEVIRKRVALRQRAHALSSEAKTSAGILASLPFITAAMLFAVTPSYAMILLTTDSGKTALMIAAGMMTMGLLVMRSIIKRALS